MTAPQESTEPYQPRKDAAVRRQPYERYLTTDRFGREITFYLSETGGISDPLPLVVYVHGSGCTSHFVQGRDAIVPANGHITLQEVTRGKARVLVVEKPGVTFLDQPVTPEQQAGSPEFRNEHTLERWAEAVEAATRAARQLPGIAQDTLLVVGHSEGGLVACRVARDLPETVTHVASMAGGGPSQLFDLITLARRGSFFSDVSDDPDERVRWVQEQWRAIQAEPTSTEKLFFGFAYRRWSTFLASSPIEELSRVEARIYLAQGIDDAAVDPASADALDAHLRARGKDVVYDRVEGADHSFHRAADPAVDGWREQLGRIVSWYLEGE